MTDRKNYMAEYREKHREKIREQQRAWAAAHKDSTAASKNAWAERNRATINERSRVRYQAKKAERQANLAAAA